MVTDANLAEALRTFAEEMVAPANSVLFDYGERANGIYIVLRGEVAVALVNEHGNTIWTRTLHENGILGLPATIRGAEHYSRAIARETVILGFVSRDKLTKLLRDNAQIGANVVRCLSDELREARRKISTLEVRPATWLN